MQAPTQEPTPTNAPPTAPPPRRHRVWAFATAFVLILVVVGAAALILGGDDAQVIDQPASSTTVRVTPTSAVETPTTLIEAPPSTVAFNDGGSWSMTRLEEPWTGWIGDVAPLPNGGFVVATRNPGRILWSPDGVDWIDGDPQRQVRIAPSTAADGERGLSWEAPSAVELGGPEVIGVAGDRVVVLDHTEPGLWVGDLQAGDWASIRLDTADLAGQVEPFAVASNDTEVLVLGEHRPKATSDHEDLFRSADRGYLVWVVNPRTGAVDWYPLSFTWEDPLPEEVSSGAVAWVNDRWVIALEDAILVSGDGATWTQVPDEDTFDDSIMWVTSLAAGPAGVVATTEWEHEVWFSESGLKWENTYIWAAHGVEPMYADGLGFLVVSETHQVHASYDGRTWQTVEVEPSWRHRVPDGDLDTFAGEFQNLAISGHTMLVDYEGGALLLTYEPQE